MKEKQGFSLLEVMIALALISILAAMAVPAYQMPSFRAKQTQAKLALLHLATDLETHFALHQTYAHFVLMDALVKEMAPDYEITLKNVNSDHYLLAAQPKRSLSGDLCGSFYLDDMGRKESSVMGDCW